MLQSEYAVGLGITTGFIFLTGIALGAGLFTSGEALLAALFSVLLGFLPVATLFRRAPAVPDEPVSAQQANQRKNTPV